MQCSYDFLIRTHGSPEVGMGHVSRCRELAYALIRLGKRVILLINPDEIARRKLLGLQTLFLAGEEDPKLWPSARCCLVDLYRYDYEYYAQLSNFYSFLAVFDDAEFEIPANVNAVINANVYARPEQYSSHLLRLVGPQYYPLRHEVKTQRRHGFNGQVTVCLGGGDPTGQTERLVRLVREVCSCRVDVVLGPYFNDELMCKRLSGLPGVIVHRDPKNLVEVLSRSRWVVSAGGTMLIELAYLGIPTAALVVGSDQEPNVQAMDRAGAALCLGWYNQVDDATLASLLRRMEEEPDWRESLGRQASKLIDGQGSSRLAQALVRGIGLDSPPRPAKES